MSGSRKWTRAGARTVAQALTIALALVAGMVPGAASANGPGDAVTGDGDDLAALLIAHDVVFDDIGWERHLARGRLIARTFEGPHGVISLGAWRIEAGARCLRWTADMVWECYDVARDGADGIIFTDSFGNAVRGRLVPR